MGNLRDDFALLDEWLRSRGDDRVSLWALGTGAILAMDYARQAAREFERMVLWRPVMTGKQSIMRLYMMKKAETLGEIRKKLRAGEQVDVGGYTLSPELANALEELSIAKSTFQATYPVYWVEAVTNHDDPLPEATRVMLEEWREDGCDVRWHTARGKPIGYREPLFCEPDLQALLQVVFCEA